MKPARQWATTLRMPDGAQVVVFCSGKADVSATRAYPQVPMYRYIVEFYFLFGETSIKSIKEFATLEQALGYINTLVPADVEAKYLAAVDHYRSTLPAQP